MATIKSFTSLEQSRKLAKILPLESADQTWARIAIDGANLDVPEELQYRHNGDMPFQYYSGIGTPCWSLAALLKYLSEIKPQVYTPVLFPSESKWILQFAEYSHGNVYEVSCDNPIDACVKMIEKLNELKML